METSGEADVTVVTSWSSGSGSVEELVLVSSVEALAPVSEVVIISSEELSGVSFVEFSADSID